VTRLGPTFDTSPNFVQLVHIPNLNPLTHFVRELSWVRTDGHGNHISPMAGLKMPEEFLFRIKRSFAMGESILDGKTRKSVDTLKAGFQLSMHRASPPQHFTG
jgi:hypothetical protein